MITEAEQPDGVTIADHIKGRPEHREVGEVMTTSRRPAEPEGPRSAADKRYYCARQQWMGRLGNTGRKMSEVSDDELIREAREWVDWRWSDYRKYRAAEESGDMQELDDCMGITQIEPPDSPHKNYEEMYRELVNAVAARRGAS